MKNSKIMYCICILIFLSTKHCYQHGINIATCLCLAHVKRLDKNVYALTCITQCDIFFLKNNIIKTLFYVFYNFTSYISTVNPSSLGQSHASTYHRSLAISSTIRVSDRNSEVLSQCGYRGANVGPALTTLSNN